MFWVRLDDNVFKPVDRKDVALSALTVQHEDIPGQLLGINTTGRDLAGHVLRRPNDGVFNLELNVVEIGDLHAKFGSSIACLKYVNIASTAGGMDRDDRPAATNDDDPITG